MRDYVTTYLGDFRVHGCCSDGGGQVGRRRAEWNANTERHVGGPQFLANPNGGQGYLYPDIIGRYPPWCTRTQEKDI